MTQNWPKFLGSVVKAINNSPNSAIGGIRPASISSPTDDPLIDHAIGYQPDVPVGIQKANQKQYERNKSELQVGNYVFLDFVPKVMTKSFHTKRNQIFRISRVDAGKTPVLYKLEDLMGAEITGYYYKEQLAKTTRPKKGEFFKVEKILAHETRRGKEYVYVKYLHYGPKFNRWILKTNLLVGE